MNVPVSNKERRDIGAHATVPHSETERLQGGTVYLRAGSDALPLASFGVLHEGLSGGFH